MVRGTEFPLQKLPRATAATIIRRRARSLGEHRARLRAAITPSRTPHSPASSIAVHRRRATDAMPCRSVSQQEVISASICRVRTGRKGTRRRRDWHRRWTTAPPSRPSLHVDSGSIAAVDAVQKAKPNCWQEAPMPLQRETLIFPGTRCSPPLRMTNRYAD